MHAHALRDDGSVVEGLYAAGNVSAPVMGHTYPGPGGTIGPAMAFGYLAALHIAGKASNVAQSFHVSEPPSVKFPGIAIELSRVLHASEAVSAPAPIPFVAHRPCGHQVHRHLGQGQGRGDLVGDTFTAPDGTPLCDAEAVDLRARRGGSAATVVRDVIGAPGAR